MLNDFDASELARFVEVQIERIEIEAKSAPESEHVLVELLSLSVVWSSQQIDDLCSIHPENQVVGTQVNNHLTAGIVGVVAMAEAQPDLLIEVPVVERALEGSPQHISENSHP